jgi:hypothetical protein
MIERKKVKYMTAMSAHALILEPFRQKQKIEQKIRTHFQ